MSERAAPVASAVTSAGADALVDAPTRIGPYRVLEMLGRGGMGVVYLAEQREPVQREVAIKVLTVGADSATVVARFEAERQALAVMDHPNITKVFDAGITDAGWPYFVMEHVSGVPITEFADAQRLGVRDRLALVTQVCRAVQHAHLKGIIHRDLKPSNVLVTRVDGDAVCKVIDFGIAKAIQPTADSPRLTLTGIAIGTPAYMSPEQIFGAAFDVDTRADVYSLGVLLYELLAGALPYDPAAYSPMALMARHAAGEAPAPSARFAALPADAQREIAARRGIDPAGLRRALGGDLDWITLKAMETERDHRYQTPTELAADIDRHLTDRAVSASPHHRVYLLRKFVRRHRTGAIFTAITAAVVVVAAVSLAVQARRVERARAAAVTRQAQAEELISFILGDLRNRVNAIGGVDLLAKVGKTAQEYFDAVPEQDLSNEELFRRSQALEQLGELRVDRGDLADAMQLFRQSLGLVTALVARDSTNPEWQLGLGASHFWVGFIHWRQNNLDSAVAQFAPYVAITKALVAQAPDSLRYWDELGQASSNIASVQQAKGELPSALASFQEAGRAIAYAAAHDSTKLDWQLDLANNYNAIGLIERKLGDLAAAAAAHREELAIDRRLVTRDPLNQVYKQRLALAHSFLAEIGLALGDLTTAGREAATSRDLYVALAAADTGSADKRRYVAILERQLGVIALERGRAAEALAAAQASESRIASLGTSGSSAAMQLARVAALTLSARALTALGRTGEAAAAARRAVAIGDSTLTRRPRDQNMRVDLTDAYCALAEASEAARAPDAAHAAWTHAVATIDSTARATGDLDQQVALAAALAGAGRTAEAHTVAQRVYAAGLRRPDWISQMRRAGALPPE